MGVIFSFCSHLGNFATIWKAGKGDKAMTISHPPVLGFAGEERKMRNKREESTYVVHILPLVERSLGECCHYWD
jgi:hypothetical protein